MWISQSENSDDNGLGHNQSKANASINKYIFKLSIHWMHIRADEGYRNVRPKLGIRGEFIISGFERRRRKKKLIQRMTVNCE